MITNIIAQKGAVVNIYAENVTPKQGKTAPKSPKTTRKSSDIRTAERLAAARVKRAERQADERKPMWQRWDEHKALAVQVGERLIAAGLPKRGWRVKMCNQELDIVRCADCGHITIRGASLCRDRLCPLCAWRLAIKRYAAMQKIMAVLATQSTPGTVYTLITLTVKNCQSKDLAATLKAMSAAWTACTYQRWWRKYIIGWARSTEVTYNADNQTLHPHYHILVVGGGENAGRAIIREWLDRASREGLTATAAAQHYDKVYATDGAGESFAGAVCEVYKYMVKSSDTLAMPLGILHDFAVGIAGARLVSMGGEIKEIARRLSIESLDDASDTETPDEELCTHCGSRAVDKMIATWAMSGMHYYTAQGKTLSEMIKDQPAPAED